MCAFLPDARRDKQSESKSNNIIRGFIYMIAKEASAGAFCGKEQKLNVIA